jgi:hypothetical protein
VVQGKSDVSCLWPVTDVFWLTTRLSEVQLCLVLDIEVIFVRCVYMLGTVRVELQVGMNGTELKIKWLGRAERMRGRGMA